MIIIIWQLNNILNRQFESVFTKEDTSTMPDKGPSPYPDMPKLEVHWKGVHKLLKGLKTFKATGPDSIPAFILKAAADQLAPILTRLYQTSLDCGEVPTEWKDAWIVPVFKKGDKHKPANYRPVSLTSITCKLLEPISTDTASSKTTSMASERNALARRSSS